MKYIILTRLFYLIIFSLNELIKDNENGFLTEEQHNLLRSKIESVEVFSKKNEKQTALQVADGRCITVVIKFN